MLYRTRGIAIVGIMASPVFILALAVLHIVDILTAAHILVCYVLILAHIRGNGRLPETQELCAVCPKVTLSRWDQS